MTPAEMLAPQPPPTPGSVSVTDWLQAEVPDDSRGYLVRELLGLRREQGAAAYGRELTTLNGRDARCDALQEAVDLLLYLAQDAIEAGSPDLPLRARLAYALVVNLAIELL